MGTDCRGDFDPEALEDAQMEDANEEESGESGSEAEEAFDGREHYVSVGYGTRS